MLAKTKTPISATIPAKHSSILAVTIEPPLVLLVGGAVSEGAAKLEVPVLLAVEVGSELVLTGPELDIAFCLKAAAVWSPDKGGFTARTIPDLQSLLADEKNQSGWVSLTIRLKVGPVFVLTDPVV